MSASPTSTIRTGAIAVLGLAMASGAAQDEAPQASAPQKVAFADLGLTLELPALDELRALPAKGQVRGSWRGKMGGLLLEITLLRLEGELTEPGDVTERIAEHLRRSEPSFEVRTQQFVPGAYGYAAFASVVVADLRAKTGTGNAGAHLLLGGLLERGGYAVHVACRPAPSEADEAKLLAFLKDGISYEGSVRDPAWSDAEVLARWKREAPDELHEEFARDLQRRSRARKIVIRTEHYIVFTNSSGGRKFAEKMEENYDEIVKTYPFADVEGRRLMPVFLFRTADQYYDFYARVAGIPKAAARASKGHAWKDYYATWYEAPGDPVHIHEATHQVFRNRLRLGGGGSWFQEGVAAYIEAPHNARNEIANVVERGRHTPLRAFFAIPSLLYSADEGRETGGSEAADHYGQAALLIEFLRESRFGKEHFAAFMQAIGKTPPNDVEQIAGVVRRIYGVTIEELDAAFQRYCERR